MMEVVILWQSHKSGIVTHQIRHLGEAWDRKGMNTNHDLTLKTTRDKEVRLAMKRHTIFIKMTLLIGEHSSRKLFNSASAHKYRNCLVTQPWRPQLDGIRLPAK